MRKTFVLGPVATAAAVVVILGAGYIFGVKHHQKGYIEALEKKDVFDQFVDIISEADGVDEVWG